MRRLLGVQEDDSLQLFHDRQCLDMYVTLQIVKVQNLTISTGKGENLFDYVYSKVQSSSRHLG